MERAMSTYRMTYGESEADAVTETYQGVEVEREDGWVVFFRGREAFLRVQEAHVIALEELPVAPPSAR
jgi:hypothetical protein